MADLSNYEFFHQLLKNAYVVIHNWDVYILRLQKYQIFPLESKDLPLTGFFFRPI